MRFPRTILVIAGLLALAGCGPPADIWNTPRVDQIAWSPSNWIVIGTSEPSQVVIAGVDGTIKRTFDHADILCGWDPTGRYLLYAQLAREQQPGAAIENLAQRRLFAYDTADNSTLALTPQALPFQTGFWVGDETVGIIVPTRMAAPFQAYETLYGLSGTVLAHYPAPPDILPSSTVYDSRAGCLFCAATYLHHPDLYNYFYFVQNQHFRPIPAASGYSRDFAFAPAHAVAAVAALDRSDIVHHIDRLDLSQESPEPHPWLSSNQLPARSQLSSLALSPDCTHLAIAASPYGAPLSLFIYDLATGRGVNIGEGDRPVFSPDGRQVAFADLGPLPHWSGERVYVCNIDGTREHLIYSMPGAGWENAGESYSWLAGAALLFFAALRAWRRARRDRKTVYSTPAAAEHAIEEPYK